MYEMTVKTYLLSLMWNRGVRGPEADAAIRRMEEDESFAAVTEVLEKPVEGYPATFKVVLSIEVDRVLGE